MSRIGLGSAALIALALALRPAGADAQTLFLAGATGGLTVPAIAETDYDAPSVSGPTAQITAYAWCPNGGGRAGRAGCTLQLAYGANGQGTPMQIQVQVLSASNSCRATPPIGSWTDVGSVPLFTTKKNQLCIVRLQFRVAGLSYSAYPYPAGGNPYQQDVVLNFVRG